MPRRRQTGRTSWDLDAAPMTAPSARWRGLAGIALVLLLLVAFLSACGGSSGPKVHGNTPAALKIGALLAAKLDKRGEQGIRDVSCSSRTPVALPGFRCSVLTTSTTLVCDAHGSGLGGMGTSSLADASCDTRAHYQRVMADTARLVRQALAVGNQDAQLLSALTLLQSEGQRIDCLVGRDDVGDRLTTAVVFSFLTSAGSPVDVVVTPDGSVTVTHLKYPDSTGVYGGCDFNGTLLTISTKLQRSLLVSETAHAEMVSLPSGAAPSASTSVSGRSTLSADSGDVRAAITECNPNSNPQSPCPAAFQIWRSGRIVLQHTFASSSYWDFGRPSFVRLSGSSEPDVILDPGCPTACDHTWYAFTYDAATTTYDSLPRSVSALRYRRSSSRLGARWQLRPVIQASLRTLHGGSPAAVK